MEKNSIKNDTITENKSNIVEKCLFEYLNQNNQLINIDDTHFKKLNSILSNLSLDIIKKSYELKKFDIELNKKALEPKKKQRIKKSESLDQKKNLISSSLTKIINTSKEIKRPNSAQSNLCKLSSNFSKPHLDISNQIVIHVCDEAKRLKQDFTCPRDLLVEEMKYFSHNLNTDIKSSNQPGPNGHSNISQSALSRKNLDEIDISVHCDINIFDWLMRYVKRNHPYLVEKNIASTTKNCLTEENNFIKYTSDNIPKYIEPKLDASNCVSILLSSDFLIMGDLVDKCVLFMAKNLESVLVVPCVMTGINEQLLIKIAACVNLLKLNEVLDKKDKIKTRLFQRKLEFMFDLSKFELVFNKSSILNEWRLNKYEYDEKDINEDNYLNYLYELENDASSLFKCKLCSRLMTKKQSLNLKCQLALLSKHGDYIYLHVPDDKFDLTKLLKMLKEKLKTWQNVYWFIWCLIKSFKCKKCNEWFRLVEFNKCRLNNNTFCDIHDSKINFDLNDKQCSCINSDHVLDFQSANFVYSKSKIYTEISRFESPESRLNKYVQNILDCFEKNRHLILNGSENGEENISVVESIEFYFKNEQYKLNNNNNNNNKIKIPIQNNSVNESYFIDSITAKNVSLIGKNLLNLIKLTLLSYEPNSNFDLNVYLNLVTKLEPNNLFNSLEVFNWLKNDQKMKWDISKPTRLNQDNQREDDLKRFREISSYIIRAKLLEENYKPVNNRHPIAVQLANNNNNSNMNINNNFAGGIYCKVENEWKQRSF